MLLTFLVGPIAFAIWLAGFVLGIGLLAFFIRQGWLVLALSLIGMGCSFPGFLTAVTILGAVFCGVGWYRWHKMQIGYTL